MTLSLSHSLTHFKMMYRSEINVNSISKIIYLLAENILACESDELIKWKLWFVLCMCASFFSHFLEVKFCLWFVWIYLANATRWGIHFHFRSNYQDYLSFLWTKKLNERLKNKKKFFGFHFSCDPDDIISSSFFFLRRFPHLLLFIIFRCFMTNISSCIFSVYNLFLFLFSLIRRRTSKEKYSWWNLLDFFFQVPHHCQPLDVLELRPSKYVH